MFSRGLIRSQSPKKSVRPRRWPFTQQLFPGCLIWARQAGVRSFKTFQLACFYSLSPFLRILYETIYFGQVLRSTLLVWGRRTFRMLKSPCRMQPRFPIISGGQLWFIIRLNVMKHLLSAQSVLDTQKSDTRQCFCLAALCKRRLMNICVFNRSSKQYTF